MWNSDNWKQFLSTECMDYPGKAVTADAKFLSEQDLGPSQFNTLIEVYEREGIQSFKKLFPNFTIGNLIRLIDGLRGYVLKQENLAKKTAEEVVVGPSYSEGPPAKKIRFDRSTQNVEWFNNVKKYMLYFERDGEKENFPRRCACAISPTIAVTFSHGRNRKFTSRIAQKGKLITQGSVIKLYSLYNSQHQQAISAEVVGINPYVDFILLESLDGRTFFDGKEDEHILEEPVVGMKLLAIGLSSNTQSQEAVTAGVVLSTGPLHRRKRQMVSDIIAWGGDSGGGLFSPNNKLLGIVSASQPSDEGELTRTYFAPATEIIDAWEMFLEESGKIAKARGIRRSEE